MTVTDLRRKPMSRIRALPPMTVIVNFVLELTGTKIDTVATLFVLKSAQMVFEFTSGSNEERLKALFVSTVAEHFRGMRMPQEPLLIRASPTSR